MSGLELGEVALGMAIALAVWTRWGNAAALWLVAAAMLCNYTLNGSVW